MKEDTYCQNMYDTFKAAQRGKCIAFLSFIHRKKGSDK